MCTHVQKQCWKVCSCERTGAVSLPTLGRASDICSKIMTTRTSRHALMQWCDSGSSFQGNEILNCRLSLLRKLRGHWQRKNQRSGSSSSQTKIKGEVLCWFLLFRFASDSRVLSCFPVIYFHIACKFHFSLKYSTCQIQRGAWSLNYPSPRAKMLILETKEGLQM